MRFVFGVVIRGSVPFLFVVATLYLFALLALALFVSSRAAIQQEAFQISLPVRLSVPFRWLAACAADHRPAPARYPMVAIMRGVVLREAGFMQMLPHVLALVLMSIVLIAVSARSFRKVAM